MSKVKSLKEEQKYNDTARPIYFTIFIAALILVSIAYAALAINLGININGIKPMDDLSWNIHFDNIKVKEGSIKPIVGATIDETKTGINYVINLKQPGDYYEFTVDIENEGSMDAKIYDIISDELTATQKRYLEYKISYIDGTVPKKDEVLNDKTTKKLLVQIKFKDDITAADLPKDYQDLNLSYQIIYVEK